MPGSAEAVKQMSWPDLQTVFAVTFASDIATVTAGESAAVIRARLSELGEDGRVLLREALDEIEAFTD